MAFQARDERYGGTDDPNIGETDENGGEGTTHAV